MYYVYILRSLSTGVYYKGFTENPDRRLFEHQNELSYYTSSRGPWEMVYLVPYATKNEAFLEERRLKRCNPNYLKWLIANNKKNLMKK